MRRKYYYNHPVPIAKMEPTYSGKRIVIRKEDLGSKTLRRRLARLHRTTDLGLDKKQLLKEMRRFREEAKRMKKLPDWRLLFAITNGVESGFYPQLFPYYLLDIFAPLFFTRFPQGEIWFFERELAAPRALDDDEAAMVESMLGDRPYHAPQSYGIGFEGMMETIALMLPLILRYPHVHGRFAGSIGGFLLFLCEKPISLLEQFEPDISDFLRYDTVAVYSDSLWSPGTLPRPQFEPLCYPDFKKYVLWYGKNLENLNAFLLSIPDRETRLLTSYSLARICVDTYLIQLTMEPYLRKVLFLSLLDKYANLISKLGSGRSETAIWKELLSISVFESKMVALVKNTPDKLGLLNFARNMLSEIPNDMLYTKYGHIDTPHSFENEALDYLRTYRNSYHGYLLNNPKERASFLNHSGDIPNHLPDYAICLWHILIANPPAFMSAL